MGYAYFYGIQADQFTFYRVPKLFFTQEQYRCMTTDDKLLYGMLLDRMNLSAKNGWQDNEGRVYIIYPIEEIMEVDELRLDRIGDHKTAQFLIMSDNDPTFNFIIAMFYTQLFNLLCERADQVFDGRLPVCVRCLIDEVANVGQIPNLEKLMATVRSREISICLVLQAKCQLKAIYKDNADTIIGNMDAQQFLGGTEPGTLKDMAEAWKRTAIFFCDEFGCP